ncbi:putative alanine rich transmembrane protein [Mycobacterium xenopi 3993]|nr:putative alanine rich transmembrane protein [Mycobacterium xenopi 3993]
MKSSQQAMGGGGWRTLWQRGLDTANELSDLLAHKISAVTDPRARLLRRRRRALRWAVIFGVASAFWATVTVLLAAWGWFVALLVVTGSVAAGSAIPATLLLMRYRWLRSLPLPTQRPASVRRLPPPGSAARPAMHALGASERGFFSLLSVMERATSCPPTKFGT